MEEYINSQFSHICLSNEAIDGLKCHNSYNPAVPDASDNSTVPLKQHQAGMKLSCKSSPSTCFTFIIQLVVTKKDLSGGR